MITLLGYCHLCRVPPSPEDGQQVSAFGVSCRTPVLHCGHSWAHRYCGNLCIFPKKMCHLQREADVWSKAKHQQGADEPVPLCDVYN